MKHFKTGLNVDIKSDNSPVTIADQQADIHISNALRKLTPHIPVISEEGDYDSIPHTTTYWLVDPLDGTRSFIKGEPEFTVNIGLVVNNHSKLGVVYAPALKELYFTGEDGKAYKQTGGKAVPIRVSAPAGNEGLRVIASKNHRNQLTEEFIKTLKVKEFVGSASSYKFCLVADGKADIYPRFSNTMQWDTCAGQAILEAAGGKMTLPDGNDFLYKFNYLDVESLKNPHFIASNTTLG